VQRLAFLVATVSGIPDQRRRESEVLRFLTSDAEALLTMWKNTEAHIQSSLRAGPPEGPGRSAMGDLQGMCDELVANVSESARAEIRAHVKKLQADREAAGKAKAGADEATEAPQ